MRHFLLCQVMLLHGLQDFERALAGRPRGQLDDAEEIALVLARKEAARQLDEEPACRGEDGAIYEEPAAGSAQHAPRGADVAAHGGREETVEPAKESGGG